MTLQKKVSVHSQQLEELVCVSLWQSLCHQNTHASQTDPHSNRPSHPENKQIKEIEQIWLQLLTLSSHYQAKLSK